MSICGGVAGRRGYNPLGVVIHNDAGCDKANAEFYKSWLTSHKLENGFAHYYVASDATLQAEEDYNEAWHCANLEGNRDFLSVEVCQSEGDELTFRKNEDKAFQLVADKCMLYGIEPSVDTIKLHMQFSATSCPRRSVAIHGGNAVACQNYFIGRVKECMDKSSKKEVVKKYIVQCGEFYDLDEAKKLGNTSLNEFRQKGTSIQTNKKVVEKNVYTIHVGKFNKVEDAMSVGNKFIEKGYRNQTSIITVEE